MERITKELIAPCGMNCGICQGYLREKNKCPGCFSGRKVGGRPIKCGRRLCTKRTGEYCYECEEFPCKSIQALDKRYQERYGMSEIANLEFIRDKGMEAFLASQREKYESEKGIICIHDGKCYNLNKT